MRGRLRAVGSSALALAFVASLAPASAASGLSSWRGACSASKDTLNVTIPASAKDTTLARSGSRFLLDGVVCRGSSDVTHVSVSDVRDHDAALELVVPARGFRSSAGEIAFEVDLGDGADSLTLRGTSGDNAIDVSGKKVNLDSRSNSTYELHARGVDGIDLRGGAGDDRFRTSAPSGDAFGPMSVDPPASTASLGSYPTARMFGGTGNDTLNGDAKVNLIVAGEGNDSLFGKGADDELQGGPGNDSLFGADGDDQLNGGPGDDQEFGGNNNDLFQQGPQDLYTSTTSKPIPDTGRVRSSLTVPPTALNAVDVNVRIYIDHARPQDLWTTLVSPTGAWVRLHERQGNGTPLDGTQFDSEANTNIANLGTRNLSGRFHPEWSMELVQSANPTGEWELMVDDKVAGTTGSIRGWELELGMPTDDANGADSMSGGPGLLDLATYGQRTQGVTGTLLGGADDGQAGESDSLGVSSTCPVTLPSGSQCADLEWLYGGSGDDTITGTDEVNDLRGAPGHDTITAYDGADQLRGANGRDVISGGPDNDTIHGQGNADTIDGGEGFDRGMYGYAPVGLEIELTDPAAGSASDGTAGNDDDTVSFVENITGTNHNDRIIGTNNVANVFAGGSGNDFMNGGSGSGNDNLAGAAGTDTCLEAEIQSGCEILNVTDTEPPTAPSGLDADVSPASEVTLTWDASSDNVGVDHYAVYRDGVFQANRFVQNFTDLDAVTGSTYNYTVRAFDADGNGSTLSAPLSVFVDGQAPSAPTNLAGEVNLDGDVSLTWDPSTDNVTLDGYRIYRDGVFLNESTSTSYLDQTAANGATYDYTVTAFDTAENESEPSNSVEVTVADTEAPSVPTNLAASVSPEYQVSLTWDASTDNVAVDHYAVYRDEVFLANSSTASYTDTTTVAGGAYSYTVKAVDAASNESGASDAVDVVADVQAPSAPTDLAGEVNVDGDVSLTWTASTDDIAVDHYAIYRDGTEIDTSASASYVDTTAQSGETYSYTVTALDAADNESGPSNSVEIALGDTTAPSVPTGVTTEALSTTKVKVTWTASTDDSATITYDVYRGVDLVGSTTATELIVSGLTPGQTSSYTVRARDDSNNLSDPSVATDGTPYALLFSDNFDSGNLSSWTSQTNMSVLTPVDEPDPVARASSTGSTRSFATKNLGSSETTIYVRSKVRLDSQSTVANLLRLQTPSGAPVLTLFSSAGRNVMLRNDVTGSNVWSGKTFTLGVWHDVLVRATIAGTSSQTEVWVDGEKIGALSGTLNLGTNPVGQLMMGDNSLSRNYTTRFDDLSVAPGFID